MIRQPDGNRTYIGEPLILDHMNIDVGYADFTKFAIQTYDQPPQLFMICDMKGMGLKLKDVRNEMSVKIMAQKSHFFNYNYLYGAYDDSTGNCKYIGVSIRNIKRYQLDIFKEIVKYFIN